jgi:arylamine N-acetyltransferase
MSSSALRSDLPVATAAVPVADYLRRIGFQGERTPTLATLTEIQHRHTSEIPFESLNPFLGEDVPLALPALTGKLIYQRRGGYCYEHNLLLKSVLEQLGFQVRGLAARVYWGGQGEAPAATHMLLLVMLRGVPYLVDAGFGALTPSAPLRIDATLAQRSFHEPYRVQHQLGIRTLQALIGDRWETLYTFDLREQWLSDYEITNWYLSHHPASQFVTSLIAARNDNGHRHILLNQRYSVRYPDGRVERHALADAGEALTLLRDVFRISVPSPDRVREKLQQIAASAR